MKPEVMRPRNRRLEHTAILAAVIALTAWLSSGCTTEAPAKVYSCTVLYRCVGDENVTARFALPCAVDQTDAEEQADEAGLEDISCTWQYVRAVCVETETEC